MLIEKNSNYAYILKYMANPTFDKVRKLSSNFYCELPQALRDELYEELDRGIDILDTEPQMAAYLHAFGQMHKAKLEYSLGKLPKEFLEQPEINIIDYGCGQAMGTMCYADYLRENGCSQKIKTITLIEPSEICLKRAALHVSVFFPNAKIKTVNKKFDDLTQDDIVCSEEIPTLHILSNVLDMLNFNLDKFSVWVKDSLNGYNQFVCVGPCFNYAEKDNRMADFCSLLNGNVYLRESLDRYELEKDKAWTAQILCFSIGELVEEKFSIELTSGTAELSPKKYANTEGLKINVEDANGMAKLSNAYTPMVLSNRLSFLSRMFSMTVSGMVAINQDEVNDLIAQEQQKENPDADELSRLNTLRAALEGPDARKFVIMHTSVSELFNAVKNTVEEYMKTPEETMTQMYGKEKGQYILQEYAKILDNFPALISLACTNIEMLEHVRIVPEHIKTNGQDVLGGSVQEDTEEQDSQDTEDDKDDDENSGKGEDLFYKIREVDPYTTLSKKIKNLCSSIHKVNTDGTWMEDDIGQEIFHNPEYIHLVLLNVMQDCTDAKDFHTKDELGDYFPILENAVSKYPWMREVLNILYSDPNLAGAFYSDLRQDYIQYCEHYKEGLVDRIKNLNKTTAYESALNAAEKNYMERNMLSEHSLYDASGNINPDSVEVGKKLAEETQNLIRSFDVDDIPTISGNMVELLHMLGFPANVEIIEAMLENEDTAYDVRQALYQISDLFSSTTKSGLEVNPIATFDQQYKMIAQRMGIISDSDTTASFLCAGKQMFSYSAPNYIDTLVKIVKDKDKWEAFLEEEYGQYEWFKNQKTGTWKSGLLQDLAEDENARLAFDVKELKSIDNTDYEKWKPKQIVTAFVTEYLSNKDFTWYHCPIMSDSPVAKFMRLRRYRGSDYKNVLKSKFRDVVKQEMWRINLVKDRRAAGITPIQNFDANGDKFHFFPEFNKMDVAEVLTAMEAPVEVHGSLYDTLVYYKEKGDSKSANAVIDACVEYSINTMFGRYISNMDGVNACGQQIIQICARKIRQVTNIEGVNMKEVILDTLEEYFWNQAYATTQIIEFLTTDLAFYKDDIDFQKRFKEVYAAGKKLDSMTNYGKEFRNTVYIKDLVSPSSTFEALKSALDAAVEEGRIQTYDRDNILNKFKQVNATDAQGYVSPESMRSMLDMMGAWDDDMEKSYQKFTNPNSKYGKWDMSDFNRLWLTIKPFLYTQISKPDGLGGKIKVPHQVKNSEFVLLAAYSVIAGPLGLGKSGQLKGMQRFMTEHGIDAIQFATAVKVGSQGAINLNYTEDRLTKLLNDRKDLGFPENTSYDDVIEHMGSLLEKGEISQKDYNDIMKELTPNEDETYNLLKSKVYTDGNSANGYNPEVVHQLPYRDFSIQQPAKEHVIDAESFFGSQQRNLILADLPEDFNINVNGKEYDKKGVYKLYTSCIVENLLESYSNVFERIKNKSGLQKLLLDHVRGNVQYGRDMINVLQLVDDGNWNLTFNMPFNNPSIAPKIEQLFLSLIKNNITKQYIKGGHAVLVSNYGLIDQLHLQFRTVNGKKVLSGVECYLPAASKQFFKSFMKIAADGSQYLDANEMPEELRKCVGYRIPTRGKCSMVPLIIKGFLPQQNGSSIMLPADITTLSGADFDFDKLFLMFPEFTVQKYDIARARRDFKGDDAVDKLLSGIIQKYGNENADALLEESPEDFMDWWSDNKEKYRLEKPIVRKIRYNNEKSVADNTREQRNNMLIDIIFGILTHPDTQHQVLHPGNFDIIELEAGISRIVNNKALTDQFMKEYGIANTEQLEDFILVISRRKSREDRDFINSFIKRYRTVKSQLTPETFVYNHRKIMEGGWLIGIYANNSTTQAKYQWSNLELNDEYVFQINGRIIKSLHDITSELGEIISENCAQFSAASVDNAKNPQLMYLMQDMTTAPVTAAMLRMGLSISEINLMFNQPVVRAFLKTEPASMAGFKLFADKFFDHKGASMGDIPSEITSKQLLHNIIEATAYNGEVLPMNINKNLFVAIRMAKIIEVADALSLLTQISRADSPNGAIAHTVAGAKVQTERVRRFKRSLLGKHFPLKGIENVLNTLSDEKSVVPSDVNSMREFINKSDLPMLQAFYTLGIDMPVRTLRDFFPQVNSVTDGMLKEIFDNTIPESLKNCKIAERTILQFYKGIVQSVLSDTKLFGGEKNEFERKKNWYLNGFPKEFLKAKRENANLNKIGIFSKITVNNKGQIVFENSARLRQQTRELFIRDMDSLLYMGEAELELAKNLFIYSFYKDGFWFGKNSLGQFFSTDFFNHFPEVNSALRLMSSGYFNPNRTI